MSCSTSVRWIGLLVVCVACARTPAPAQTPVQELEAYLHELGHADLATRRAAVASWKLDARTFASIVVPPFDTLWPAYAARFDDAVAATADALPRAGAARRHFADDPKLSHGQVRLRWTLPVLYPSLVVEGVDAVFVRDGTTWRALLGLDEAIMALTRDFDPACADRLALAGPPGSCTDLAYNITAAAARGDRAELTRACQLAQTLCRP